MEVLKNSPVSSWHRRRPVHAMHGNGWFCVDTCSLDPEKQLVSWQKKKEMNEKKHAWGANGSRWHLGLRCIRNALLSASCGSCWGESGLEGGGNGA